MPSAKTSQVTKISSSSRTVTQTFSSIQGKIGLQQSFEEISSPSRQLFLENASLRMSPGWVSGHGSLFDSPKSTGSLSPIKPPKTRRSSVLVKKNLVVTSTVDSFKKPAVFISPTGVKTRARRSSIYQKSGKNLLTGLDSKARRDSLAVIRSKKLVSESDYVFAVPTADSAQRKKLVSKNSRTRKAAESKSSPKKSSPKKASSKSKTKGNSPVKKSVKEINLLDSKKSTQLKVVKKKSSPKKEKSVRSKAKAKTPAREVELAEDNDDDDDEKDFNDENDILSPRRTRKTPGKSRKRSLSTVTKSAQKRKRSPSRSPAPAKKKKSPSSKRKSSSPQKKETPKKSSSKSKKSSSSTKKKTITKDSPITSARKNSLEVSLTPLELDDSFTLKLNDSDKKTLTKKSESSKKLTPGKSAKSTTKKTPRSSAKKSSTRKTPSSNKRGSSSSKKPSPKSSEKKSSRKSIIETTDEVAKVLEFEPIETFDSQIDYIEVEDDIEIEDDISMTTTKTSLKSKTPLTSLKMKSILDSVSVPNGADKKRKTTDFVEPQSANKRRRFDMEKFEKIVASTPRDMRLDILSGRRPELSPIPGTINKNINNSLSTTKQVTIFSDKSTFLSSGPSNLSPVASTSPLIVTEVETGVFKDFVDGNDDDFDYSHISLSQKPTDPEPYLYDYDSDLDTSHSNVRPGCTIL